jgi:hypothetical protein
MINITELRTGDVVVRRATGRRYIVKVIETPMYRCVQARIEKDGKPFGRIYSITEASALDFTNEWLTS